MIYPDLYALLYSDPEAVRQLKTHPAHAQSSLVRELPAAEIRDLHSYQGKLGQQEEKQMP